MGEREGKVLSQKIWKNETNIMRSSELSNFFGLPGEKKKLNLGCAFKRSQFFFFFF